jgi:hypothetical protein
MNGNGMNYNVSLSQGLEVSSSARVDFNSREEDGTIRVPLRAMQALAPGVGGYVLLQDLEGHMCTGEVVAVSQDVLSIRPLWETWRPAMREVFVNLMEVLEASVEAARRSPRTATLKDTKDTATAA